MEGEHHFLAVDLGATSGRTIVGTLRDGKIGLQELTRFKKEYVPVGKHYYWNFLGLYAEIVRGLQTAREQGYDIESIGIDTWGVDFVLVGRDGLMLRAPFSYRDPHTEGVMDKYFQHVPKERVYGLSGIQFMNFNSIFQLYAMRCNNDSALAAADKILFLPDALSYLLTGNMVTERTILSTSALMDAQTGQIAEELLSPLGIGKDQFAPIVEPGFEIGRLSPQLQKKTGLGAVPVIAVAGHDTASAVAAVPALDDDFAYLSSGTWSLMGIETPHPVITKDTFEMNFTNEGGVEGTTRFLKNICGMWLLECCRKEWADAPRDYGQLYKETQEEEPFRSFIFPDSPEFANPTSMVQAIKDYCRRTNQPVPETYGQQARCIFDSLAMRYRQVFEMLSTLASKPIRRLHIIGGGSQNGLLNQFTANATGVAVYSGPTEATAIGNVMIQAKAAGLVDSLKGMRQVITQSVSPQEYLPEDAAAWQEGYAKYLKCID